MYLCLDYLFISNTEYLIHKFYKFSSDFYFVTKSFNEGDRNCGGVGLDTNRNTKNKIKNKKNWFWH